MKEDEEGEFTFVSSKARDVMYLYYDKPLEMIQEKYLFNIDLDAPTVMKAAEKESILLKEKLISPTWENPIK